MLRRLSMTKSPIGSSGRKLSVESDSSNTISNGSSSSSVPVENEGDKEGKTDEEKMQRKTFRRWANRYLASRKLQVNHIINDWENGILLTHLLEILSQTSLPKYNANPKIKLHSLENLNTCLAFMKNSQKINLVNVGSNDIYSHNPTIVMGLIWCLILRYNISGGKLELLLWVQSRCDTILGYQVKGFTDDWKNGMAFAALISSLTPLDFSSCSTSDPVGNMEKAFKAADLYLEVDGLLDPQDVIHNCDEKSIMAYVGEIYNAAATTNKAPRAVARPSPAQVKSVAISTAQVSWTPPSSVLKVKLDCIEERTGTVVSTAEFETLKSVPNTASRSASSESTHLIEGLSPSTKYKVVLTALSFKSQSEPSDPVEFCTLAKSFAGPSVATVGDSRVTLSWSPYPSATSYEIQLRESSLKLTPWDLTKPGVRVVKCSTGTTCNIDGLDPEGEYECRIISKGCVEEPEPSSATTFMTSLKVPERPKISNTKDSSFDLSFEKYPKIKQFKIQIREPSESWEEACEIKIATGANASNGGENKKISIKQLSPAKSYEVRVSAITEKGNTSEPSPVAVVNTEKAKPRMALVTGADFRSGCALVLKLIQNSSEPSFENGFARVFVCSEHPSTELLALAKHPKVFLLEFDPSNRDSVQQAAKILAKETDRVDTCINNAALPLECLADLLSHVKTT